MLFPAISRNANHRRWPIILIYSDAQSFFSINWPLMFCGVLWSRRGGETTRPFAPNRLCLMIIHLRCHSAGAILTGSTQRRSPPVLSRPTKVEAIVKRINFHLQSRLTGELVKKRGPKTRRNSIGLNQCATAFGNFPVSSRKSSNTMKDYHRKGY